MRGDGGCGAQHAGDRRAADCHTMRASGPLVRDTTLVGREENCSAGGHEATDTGLAYAPVSQVHGHHHTVQCFALLCGGGGGDTEAHFPNPPPPLLGRRDGRGGSGWGCPTCRSGGGGGATQHLWLKMIPTSRSSF